MERQNLNGGWNLLWKEKTLDTQVPFSVYHDLFSHGEIEDPFTGTMKRKLFCCPGRTILIRQSLM